MQFSFVTLFAIVLGIIAAMLPVTATPLLSFSKLPVVNRFRVGTTLRPNKWANGPIAVDIAPPSPRDELMSLSDVSWTGKRFIDVPCTEALNEGTSLPVKCRDRQVKNTAFFAASKLVARMFMAGLAPW